MRNIDLLFHCIGLWNASTQLLNSGIQHYSRRCIIYTKPQQIKEKVVTKVNNLYWCYFNLWFSMLCLKEIDFKYSARWNYCKTNTTQNGMYNQEEKIRFILAVSCVFKRDLFGQCGNPLSRKVAAWVVKLEGIKRQPKGLWECIMKSSVFLTCDCLTALFVRRSRCLCGFTTYSTVCSHLWTEIQ